MSKKVSLIVVLALAAVVSLTACELSASNPPQATPTAENSFPAGQPTGISLVEAWGTSTAIYEQTAIAQGLIPASPTPEISEANPTDTPEESGTTSGEPTATPNVAPVVVATATPGRPATYTLQAGEFPYCIARRFNVDPADLLALNGLNSGQVVQTGLVLRIPTTGSFPDGRALHQHPAQYTVAVDDTIYKIACYFGDVEPTAIAAANGLALDSPLATGQVLNIP
jgi:LysM repeat protein